PPPKKTKAKAKKTSRAEKTVPPPPMPKPPGPPPNWLELSGYNADEKGEEPPAGEEQTDKPVATDNWSLIRTKDGQSGWVLTRRIYMAIPDEVAQYAEGHRIVSYFPLGEVRDGDQSRQQWLWTTIAGPAGAYDFDSFRVFVWSIKRHRYETAYIERNIQGHSPVLLGQVTLAGPRGAQGAGATYPGFSVCVQKADGSRRMRDYAFLNPSVRFAGERDCPAPVSLTSGAQTFAAPALPQAAPGAGSGGPAKSTSWFARLKAKVRGLFGK
ncbi:MAG TPA: hypothetical protein VMU19_05580, partial [Bryobacteraceae bacterium]|nr:hypothetical protein [Bryobacteraceae bacterium]